MKKFIVAVISFYENDLKQFKIEANNDFDAVKKAMVEFQSEEYKQSEIDFQSSSEYPKDIEGLDILCANGDLVFSVIEISSF